jgi:hypothetical protein
MSTTRTTSPYFSPNSAMAPPATASAYGFSTTLSSTPAHTPWLTIRSTSSTWSGRMGPWWVKSKRSRSARPRIRPGARAPRARGGAPRGAGAWRCGSARCRAAAPSGRGRAPAEGDGALELAQRGRAALDLAHLVDVDAPALPDDLAAVADLAAALGVERRLAEEHGHAAAVEPAQRGDLRLDRHRLVADEVAARVGAVGAGRALPRRRVAERVGGDAEVARLALVLRLLALPAERRLEARRRRSCSRARAP